MKKILSLSLSIGFALAVHAQVNQLKPQPRLSKITEKAVVGNNDPIVFTTEINPTTANNRAADEVIGETWYDLQTNSTMMQRMWTFDDGTMGGTWTRGMNPTAYADRGTGYNYYDGSSWGPMPTERIEAVRTGWPSYAPYGENGEIVCSHTFTDAGLVFSWRQNKGEGDWNYFSMVGPAGHEGIAWPRMITSGENHEIIHVLANIKSTINGGTPYNGQEGALAYSRSTDGGLTWDPENLVLDGVSSDYFSGISADSYAWASPQGNTLAFVYFGGITDGVVMKSTDGGDNWERILFYQSPDPFFDGNGGDLPQCGGGDGYNAVSIDNTGLVHVAFGRQIHLDDTPGDDSWSYFPYSDGLVYWNEGMDVLDTTKLTADIIPSDWETHYLYQHGNLAAWTLPRGDDTIVGVPYYGASLTTMPQLFSTVENEVVIVQVIYSAISVGFDNSENNFHHICGRFTDGVGLWSSFTDYTSDVFHIFSECVYPSLAPEPYGGKFYFIYQSDNMPGNSLQPSDSPSHDPILNFIVTLSAPVPTLIGVDETEMSFMEIGQNFPNPFKGQTYVEVSLNKTSNVSLEVYTLTGQKIVANDYGLKSTGNHTLKIDGSQLTTGVYFYTVTAGQNKVTRKMMVE